MTPVEVGSRSCLGRNNLTIGQLHGRGRIGGRIPRSEASGQGPYAREPQFTKPQHTLDARRVSRAGAIQDDIAVSGEPMLVGHHLFERQRYGAWNSRLLLACGKRAKIDNHRLFSGGELVRQFPVGH
jgi:hypothetical protein